MKIEKIGVTYSELRTFANYENKRYGLTLEAVLTEDDNPAAVKTKLTYIAQEEVRKFFADEKNYNDEPF